MENKKDMIAVIKIIGIATSIGKAGIDFDEGQKQCKEVMKDFEAQIRQDQKEKCAKAVRKIPETIVTGVCINPLNAIKAIMEAK